MAGSAGFKPFKAVLPDFLPQRVHQRMNRDFTDLCCLLQGGHPCDSPAQHRVLKLFKYRGYFNQYDPQVQGKPGGVRKLLCVGL